MNKVILEGGVPRDPALTPTKTGGQFCRFSVGCDELLPNRDADEKSTEWVDCVAFGQTAEWVSTHVIKGSKIHVEGKLQTRKVEREGMTRWYTNVVVSTARLMPKGAPQQEFRDEDSTPF